MAEWLGTGLQNQVQQFDSAWYLKTKGLTIRESFCFGYRLTSCRYRDIPLEGDMPEPASQNPGGFVARVLRTHPTLRHGADAPWYLIICQ